MGYHKKGRRVPKGASSKTRRLNGERKKWVPNNANEMWTRCQAPSEKRLFLLYTHGRHQIHFPQSPWDGWLTTTLLSCFNPLFCAWCSCVWNSVSSNTFSFRYSLGVNFHLSTYIYSIFQGIFFNYFCFSCFFHKISSWFEKVDLLGTSLEIKFTIVNVRYMEQQCKS